MRSPSPSDLCWVIGFTPQGRWIAPILRSAVRAEWPGAQQIAANRLGDVSLAHELMEQAIEETKEYLETMSSADVDQARQVLSRYYLNAVRRWSRSQSRFVFRGSATDIEVLSLPTEPAVTSVEAKVDLNILLEDTPPDLRRAMLLRYGARSSWEDVAQEMAKSKDAIRMRCQRELNRIRKKLGIRGQSG
jgi:DNA-directed RNA polymerase specialized sigma24 family protein